MVNTLNLPNKETLISIIENNEDLSIKYKDQLMNLINNHYNNTNYKMSRFRLKKVVIEPNEGTLYDGLEITLDPNKPITIIKGKNNTGKTMSFQKIQHLFTRHEAKSSTYKNLLTKLDIKLESEKTNVEIDLGFHSQFGFNGDRKFKIRSQLMNEDNITEKYRNLKDPRKYLQEHFLIDYNINNTMFVPELPGHSFVREYCKNEVKFRKLYRIKLVNKIFDLVNKWLDKVNEKLKENDELLASMKKIKKNTVNRLKKLEKDKERYEFLVNKKEDLKNAKMTYEEFNEELKRKNKNRIKKIRGLQSRLKNKRNELKSLNQYNLKEMNDKFEALYQKKSSFCFECDQIIPLDKFKERVEKHKCYSCGIGSQNYEHYFEILPKYFGEKAIQKKAELKKEIKEIKKEINNISDKENIIKKPPNISMKVWKEANYFSTIEDLEEEINLASEFVSEYSKKIETFETKLNKINEDINEHQLIKENNGKRRDSLKNLKSSIKSLEEKNYKRFRDIIFTYANRFLIGFIDNKVGKIKYNDDQKLVLINSMFKNVDLEDHKYEERTFNDLSAGTQWKVELSFALAFLTLNLKHCMRPLGVLFIDGLSFLEKEYINSLFEILHDKKEYQVIIFTTEIPSEINLDRVKVEKIERNPLLREIKDLNNLSQTKISTFF